MIHIDRPELPIALREPLRAATAGIVAAWNKKGTQAALKISNEWKIAKDFAIEVFHGKCAYCETPYLSRVSRS